MFVAVAEMRHQASRNRNSSYAIINEKEEEAVTQVVLYMQRVAYRPEDYRIFVGKLTGLVQSTAPKVIYKTTAIESETKKKKEAKS